MRIVASDAGVIAVNVHVLGVVYLAFVLITALDFGAIERGSRSKVVDIAESEGNILALVIFDRGNNSIRIFNLETRDLGIHRCFGFASLVADETT